MAIIWASSKRKKTLARVDVLQTLEPSDMFPPVFFIYASCTEYLPDFN